MTMLQKMAKLMEYSHLLDKVDECEDPYMRLVYALLWCIWFERNSRFLQIISERKVRPLESVHSFHGNFSTSNRKHTRRVFSLLLFQLMFSIEHGSTFGWERIIGSNRH
ncbi:uncharacterized protein LOC130947410 [Arachis stenosperma]|uniref:uncharacterized protein LOC130947410 n=1 Tax=Arachis stenosperma TaxID=217475 RepID=UPI0025AC1FE1|nr:uncharacterized protein LOC130947410 [Arachis stenosperma]